MRIIGRGIPTAFQPPAPATHYRDLPHSRVRERAANTSLSRREVSSSLAAGAGPTARARARAGAQHASIRRRTGLPTPFGGEYRKRFGIVPPGAGREAASHGQRARFSCPGRCGLSDRCPTGGGSSAQQPWPVCLVVRSHRRPVGRGSTWHARSRPPASLERQTSGQALPQPLPEESCARAPSRTMRSAGIRAPVLLAVDA